jgi:hypothetical protein
MTHHAPLPATAQDAIAAALDDYWITSDPAGPFHTTEAAHHIDASLTGYGYTITTLAAAAAPRCTCQPPSRAAVAFTALLALACLLGCLTCLTRGELGWAVTALLGAGALAGETATNLRARRAHR